MKENSSRFGGEIVECTSNDDLAQKCFDWLRNSIESENATRVFMPAGNTPVALYDLMEKNKDDTFKKVTFVQVDDVVTGSQRGVFKRFFEKHLPSYLSQFEFIEEIDSTSSSLGADLAILGIGMNGHVAFHEPEIDHNFKFGTVDLSEATISNLRLEPAARGKTYGLAHFLRTKKILLIARGSAKAMITAETLGGRSAIPSGRLTYHDDCTLIADSEALSIFKKKRMSGNKS